MRLGEIVNLQWTDMDFIRKVIRVGNKEGFTTKSRKGRNIPMSDQLSEMMQNRKKQCLVRIGIPQYRKEAQEGICFQAVQVLREKGRAE